VIEPETQVTPAPVADAPDTTTPKTAHEDPTKLEQSGDPGAESGGDATAKGRGRDRGTS
jgi:hypothetical protein